MLALDLGQQITRRGLEVLVRGADRAIGLDLDHRLRPIDRRGLGNCVLDFCVALEVEHHEAPQWFRPGTKMKKRESRKATGKSCSGFV
jgi:hypothetical protein